MPKKKLDLVGEIASALTASTALIILPPIYIIAAVLGKNPPTEVGLVVLCSLYLFISLPLGILIFFIMRDMCRENHEREKYYEDFRAIIDGRAENPSKYIFDVRGPERHL